MSLHVFVKRRNNSPRTLVEHDLKDEGQDRRRNQHFQCKLVYIFSFYHQKNLSLHTSRTISGRPQQKRSSTFRRTDQLARQRSAGSAEGQREGEIQPQCCHRIPRNKSTKRAQSRLSCPKAGCKSDRQP